MVVTKKLQEVRKVQRTPKDAKLRNIVDMALTFSAMVRLFEEGSKDKLQEKILSVLPRIFAATAATDFAAAHDGFCRWGVTEISRAAREKDGQVVKVSAPASYGQLAKTLDVVLHVVIHYAHYPDCSAAQAISPWLNAAMDTKMMAFLAGCYPDALAPWPKTIEQVDSKDEYDAIQKAVRRFILEEHAGRILPVDVDDVYWEALNR